MEIILAMSGKLSQFQLESFIKTLVRSKLKGNTEKINFTIIEPDSQLHMRGRVVQKYL